MDVVHECNEAWEKLITGKTAPGGVATYVSCSPSFILSREIRCTNIVVP